jgi:ribosome-interacting GTPase 1
MPWQVKFISEEEYEAIFDDKTYADTYLHGSGLVVPKSSGTVCKEFKISCAQIILREDVTVDQFIDVVEGNRSYIPVLYVFNKIDALTIEELDILDQMPKYYVPRSSQHEWNLEELMEEIWDRCNMLRIYTKPKGQIPDYDEPVILHSERNPTIEEYS